MTHPIYFLEHRLKSGDAVFIETDRDDNSLQDLLERTRSGELNPIKVIEMDEETGTIENITEEFMSNVGQMLEAAE